VRRRRRLGRATLGWAHALARSLHPRRTHQEVYADHHIAGLEAPRRQQGIQLLLSRLLVLGIVLRGHAGGRMPGWARLAGGRAGRRAPTRVPKPATPCHQAERAGTPSAGQAVKPHCRPPWCRRWAWPLPPQTPPGARLPPPARQTRRAQCTWHPGKHAPRKPCGRSGRLPRMGRQMAQGRAAAAAVARSPGATDLRPGDVQVNRHEAQELAALLHAHLPPGGGLGAGGCCTAHRCIQAGGTGCRQGPPV